MPRGFLLHSRPYRETSLIATFMTDTDGRVDLIMRSARGRKPQPVLPFCLYELSWAGKSGLKHLQSCEQLVSAARITGSNLYCAFYLNEIVYRLVPQNEPEYTLLSSYSRALDQLSLDSDVESVLREFELVLLEVLGYGLDFRSDKHGAAIKNDGYYLFEPEVGITLLAGDGSDCSGTPMPRGIVGRAEQFQAIANRDFADPDVRYLAKKVLRASLAIYLGGRPLRSRELFR